MKRNLLLISLLVVSICIDAQVYSLEQCIDSALQNNISLLQQKKQYESYRLSYIQQKHNITPSVSGYVGQSWSFGRATGVDNITRSQNMSNTNFSLSANLLLFDGLGMKFRIDEARANMQSSAAQTEQLESDLRIDIIGMYLQALLKKQLLLLADSQLVNTKHKIEQQQQKIDEGKLAEGEIYSLQSQYAKEEYSKIQSESDVQLALLDLAQAMNIIYTPDFDIVEPKDLSEFSSVLPSAEEVYKVAVANRPEIRSAQMLLEAQQIALKGAKSAYSPTLSASANIGTGYYHQYGAENAAFGKQLGDNFQTNVGLTLQIPIYDRMQTPNSVKRQKISIQNQELQIVLIKQNLRKEIDQAYYNALAAHAEQTSSQKAEQSAKEAYRYMEQKFEAGRASVYEYYDAKNTYRQAESQFLQAQYNYIFKLQILEYLKGR